MTPDKTQLTKGANITLGLLGVLLVGIEIGKQAAGGDYASAYTLTAAAVASLASGNVSAVLNLLQQYLPKSPVQPEPPVCAASDDATDSKGDA